MDISMFLKFLGSNFVFSFCTILIGFSLSYILYDKVVTKGIKLKDALFEKDNFSAWLEFTGAFILPILYISAKALAGSSSENMWMDLLISLGYVVAYVILFTLLRLCSSLVVRLLNFKDENGVVRLNDEIYTQNNNAAAVFSIALSVIFVNIVSFFDPHPEYIVASLLKISVVLLITLAAIAGYSAVLGRKTTLAQEVFKDNNTAAAVEFLGFVFSVQMILSTYINIKEAISFSETLVVTLISLAVFGVLSAVFNVLFARILKIDLWDEIYQQNNAGAALGRVALYAGIGFIIINYIA
jgi:Domain of Unknown Function (DUF350).